MKKKVNDILKSVAGAGVVLGGAAAFGDADVLYTYAAEETDKQTTEADELVFAEMSASLYGSVSDKLSEGGSLTADEIKASEFISTASSESLENSLSESTYIEQSEATSTAMQNAYGDYADDLLSTENTTYKAENGDILLKQGNSYTYLYDGGSKSLALSSSQVSISGETATVKMDGLYIREDGSIASASNLADVNENSGTKVFIDGNYAVEKNGTWTALKVTYNQTDKVAVDSMVTYIGKERWLDENGNYIGASEEQQELNGTY